MKPCLCGLSFLARTHQFFWGKDSFLVSMKMVLRASSDLIQCVTRLYISSMLCFRYMFHFNTRMYRFRYMCSFSIRVSFQYMSGFVTLAKTRSPHPPRTSHQSHCTSAAGPESRHSACLSSWEAAGLGIVRYPHFWIGMIFWSFRFKQVVVDYWNNWSQKTASVELTVSLLR